MPLHLNICWAKVTVVSNPAYLATARIAIRVARCANDVTVGNDPRHGSFREHQRMKQARSARSLLSLDASLDVSSEVPFVGGGGGGRGSDGSGDRGGGDGGFVADDAPVTTHTADPTKALANASLLGLLDDDEHHILNHYDGSAATGSADQRRNTEEAGHEAQAGAGAPTALSPPLPFLKQRLTPPPLSADLSPLHPAHVRWMAYLFADLFSGLLGGTAAVPTGHDLSAGGSSIDSGSGRFGSGNGGGDGAVESRGGGEAAPSRPLRARWFGSVAERLAASLSGDVDWGLPETLPEGSCEGVGVEVLLLLLLQSLFGIFVVYMIAGAWPPYP